MKVYATEIRVTDKLPGVKPGVSARAEIIITNLHDVLTVPIQAVTTLKGKQVVFLASAPQEPVPVTVGPCITPNSSRSAPGCETATRYCWRRPSTRRRRTWAAAIIADGEALPAGVTNQIAPPRPRERQGMARIGAAAVAAKCGPPLSWRTRTGGGQPRAEEPRSPMSPRPGRTQVSGSVTNRQICMKRFDADGDGKLSAAEQAEMEREIARQRGTNAPRSGPVLN